MGVKLKDLVIKKQIEFIDLANKVIAVDFSNSAYQFLSSIRQPDGTALMDSQGRITSHLMGIWTRFTNLIQQNIKLVMVFDGKMPDLKYGEHQERYERKVYAKERYEKAEEEDDREMMARYAKQTIHLTKEMIEESKLLLNAMGIPCIHAPAEADAQLAYLCKKGDAYACCSTDYDTLLHGAPRLLTNLTLSQRKKLPSGKIIKTTPEIIDLEETCKALGITHEQLIYIGILSGTDYNPQGVVGIGPKKALKLVKEYKDPDKMFKELNAEFDWKEIYALFQKMEVKKKYVLKWGEMDVKKTKEILVEEHDFSKERVEKVIEKITEKKETKKQTGLNQWFS